jgi:hypothetical protein
VPTLPQASVAENVTTVPVTGLHSTLRLRVLNAGYVNEAMALQASAAVAALAQLAYSVELAGLPHSRTRSLVGQVTVGVVVSLTVIVCAQVLALPQVSVAVHVRVMM